MGVGCKSHNIACSNLGSSDMQLGVTCWTLPLWQILQGKWSGVEVVPDKQAKQAAMP